MRGVLSEVAPRVKVTPLDPGDPSRAVARILFGEEHLAERSEAGSHFGLFFCGARSAPRKILKISVLIL